MPEITPNPASTDLPPQATAPAADAASEVPAAAGTAPASGAAPEEAPTEASTEAPGQAPAAVGADAPDAAPVDAPAEVPPADAGAEPTPDPAAQAAEDAAPAVETVAASSPAIPDLSPAACAAALAAHFPALFGAGRMLPIKLRIQADIQQRVPGHFSKKSLSIFLHRHTTSTAYIKALVNSPHRFDLDGQPAGDIAQEHRDAGVVELERRLAIVQARRMAERDALREAQRQARRPAVAAPVEGAAAAEGVPAQPHPPRPPRAERPPRPDRPPHADAAPRGDRPPRQERAGRPPQADRPPRTDRAPDRSQNRAPHVSQAAPGPADTVAPIPGLTEAAMAPPAPSVPLTPEQVAENEARRGRAALLRAFETTTLTRSNFCALKGLKDPVLEAQLVQAREERKLHPPPVERDRERDRERPREDRPRFEDRGPRRDAPPRPGGPRGGRPPR